MVVNTINREGKTIFQVSWNGNIARGHDKQEALEIMQSFQLLASKYNCHGTTDCRA
jgi:hypothetical protein